MKLHPQKDAIKSNEILFSSRGSEYWCGPKATAATFTPTSQKSGIINKAEG